MHDSGVRVQVECRKGADPRAFFLGGRRLHVMRVLERVTEDAQRTFRVRVPGGREFVLRLDINTGEWTLARIIEAPRGRAARR
ncbi:MAG: hypothetical protein A3G81_11980 [Betaproteobacteria bacterium RIFCSPLOWO2_12_FULL_65_14]|nr:MAG: hypothetical protein A3G81_11980 [Betaproteobacteria bacterium RIFCSPLOWO2_12_FULL_65_14]